MVLCCVGSDKLSENPIGQDEHKAADNREDLHHEQLRRLGSTPGVHAT